MKPIAGKVNPLSRGQTASQGHQVGEAHSCTFLEKEEQRQNEGSHIILH